MDAPSLESKFHGSMVGLALGDAIGERRGHRAALASTEGMKEPWADGILRYTDDTVMAAALAEAICLTGEVDPQVVGEKFHEAYAREPWRGYAGGPPAVFLRVAESGCSYCEAARQVGEEMFGPGGSWGNGAAMRVAPIGLLFHQSDRLYAQAEAQARVTHTHPIAIDGAAVLARAVAMAAAMDPAAPLDADAFCAGLVTFSRNDVIRAKMTAVRQLVAEKAAPVIAARELGRTVATHESMPFAIYSFLRNPRDFAECVLCATGVGGDQDTMGAMAGCISGACVGIDAIPEDWRARVEGRDELSRLADALFRAQAAGRT